MKTFLLSLLIIQLAVGVAHAEPENSLREVVVDALYGGVAGALLGTATLAFEDHASEHTDNIRVGAGVGIILGSIYGTMRVSKSFVEMKNGHLTVQFPTLQLIPNGSHEQWFVPLVHLSDG